MDQYHRPSTKKVSSGTGGRRRAFNDKKSAHLGGVFAATKVAKGVVKESIRKRGGSRRMKIKKAGMINVMAHGKMHNVSIVKVLESHNPEYVRMNIITKGAVVETSLGKVKITNRVGQDGFVNGILVK